MESSGALKTVEFILQVLLVTFETDDNYSILFEIKKNTIRTALL